MTEDQTSHADIEGSPFDESGQPAQTEALSTDKALRLLANQRRRTILRYLIDHPESTTVTELIDLVSGVEPSSNGNRHQQRERITIGIKYIQLPYLNNMGIIEYDADTEQIRYQPHHRLEALLQCVDREFP